MILSLLRGEKSPDYKRGSAGIGRQARLRILCPYRRVGSSPIFRIENKKTQTSNRLGLFCFHMPRRPLTPWVQGLLATEWLRRSVRWEKGPLDLFLFPPHPIFRLAKKSITSISVVSYYGFITDTKIESTEKDSNYITKYITKELITMSKGQHRYLYSKNLAKPQSETLFEEDLKFMELLLSKHKDLVKIKKVKEEERGIETTYITIKKTE